MWSADKYVGAPVDTCAVLYSHEADVGVQRVVDNDSYCATPAKCVQLQPGEGALTYVRTTSTTWIPYFIDPYECGAMPSCEELGF